MGGVDWAGLDLLVELYGVEDVDTLIERIYVIKRHDPKRDDPPPKEGPQVKVKTAQKTAEKKAAKKSLPGKSEVAKQPPAGI